MYDCMENEDAGSAVTRARLQAYNQVFTVLTISA
jgi:hypothetical protein